MRTTLYLASTEALKDAALFARLLRTVPPSRQEKIGRLRVARARRLSLGAGLLLNYALAAQGLPVYAYYFTKTNGRLGAWHSGEEVYCWGNIPASSKLYDTSDRELSEVFCTYFANFARNGDPNGEGLPRWAATADGTRVLELGESVYMREERYLPLYDILDRMQGFRT